MSKKRKIIILSCMIALLVATAVCNFLLSGDSVYQDNLTATSYFAQYRSQLSSQRNEQLLQLDKIINESENKIELENIAINQNGLISGNDFDSYEDACRYAKNLKQFIYDLCKRKRDMW